MSMFTLLKHDDYVMVELPEVFYAEAAKEFQEQCQNWVGPSTHSIVVDFLKCKKFNSSAFPVFAKYKMFLKRNGISFFSINANKDIKAAIQEGGMSAIFSVCENFMQIQEQIGFKVTTRNILEADNINVLFEGVHAAFKASFGLTLTNGKPFVKTVPLDLGVGILSVVNLFESELLGVVRFYFPEIFMQTIQKSKLGIESRGIVQKSVEEIEKFSDEYMEKIKITMMGKGYDLNVTFPTVMMGFLPHLVASSKEVTIVLPFKSLFGDFWIEVAKVD